MQDALLATKFYIPPARSEIVHRTHLITQLNTGFYQNQGFGRKLTLISAAAGFGKTTLISEWIDNLCTEDDYEIAWLSLDADDNDLARFLTYFIAALNRARGIDAAIGQSSTGMLQSLQLPPVEAILTSLINESAAIPGRIVIVLDDYHTIESATIDKVITFLLDHLPPALHLVIATREDPHLPLGRLRASGQLTELRGADLRFSNAEATHFLNKVMGLGFSAQDIAILETRTEGWIAGLQLAALSMQGREDASQLIKSFTGSHRFVLDYLIEEVMEQQPESIQHFLLQTAFLNRMNGSLCDTLTGQDNGQATLEMLDRANLFIVPMDGERHWYRYHHLFADLLRQRLRQTQSENLTLLHRKASEWYEQNTFTDEAIEHALRGEDYERAASLLDKHIDPLWARGEHAKLRRWMVEIPVEFIISRPQLCIFHALYMFTSGQLDLADHSLKAAERLLGLSNDASSPDQEVQLSKPDRLELQGRLAAVRAFLASYFQEGDVQEIIRQAHRALEYLPEQDINIRRVIAAIALGDAYALKGEMPAALHAQAEAIETSRLAGNNYFLIIANLKMAVTLREQARLQRTAAICQQQWELAKESGLLQTGAAGWLLAIWGEALTELNDLDEGLSLARKGVELFKHGGDVAMLSWSYLCLIRVLFSSGDISGAEEIIRKIKNTELESNVPPWLTNLTAAWEARLWLAQGRLEAANQWTEKRELIDPEGAKPQQEPDYFTLIEYVVLVRILMAQERLDDALELLQWLLEASESGERTSRVIEIFMLQALIFQARGDTDQVMIPLERALTLAEPEGLIRTFVDEGPAMGRLLYEALSQGITPDYVRRLLAAFPTADLEPSEPARSQTTEGEWLEPLSEREIEVLQLIAEGLTNPEVADRLFLSTHTIKVHTRNIYSKLDVNTRTQAVTRARALGILPS